MILTKNILKSLSGKQQFGHITLMDHLISIGTPNIPLWVVCWVMQDLYLLYAQSVATAYQPFHRETWTITLTNLDNLFAGFCPSLVQLQPFLLHIKPLFFDAQHFLFQSAAAAVRLSPMSSQGLLKTTGGEPTKVKCNYLWANVITFRQK